MIPFPGESIGIGSPWDAYSSVDADADLGKQISFRAGHRAIAPGETWWAWVYNYNRPYLEADDDGLPLEVSWVVEVLGGAGTLVFRDFHDASWEYDAATLPNAVGSVDVTGPGTYLLTTSTFTNAVLRELGWGTGPAQVQIECTSGSVDVQQVKLRVWPASGPLGAWSSGTHTEEPRPLGASFSRQDAAGTGADPGPYWPSQAALRTAVATSTLGARDSSGFAKASVSTFYNPPTGESMASGGFTLGYFRFIPDDYVGPGEGIWIRPPEEVQRDVGTVLFDTGGAAPSIAWIQGVISGSHGSVNGDRYPQGSYHLTVTPVADFLDTGDPAVAWIGGGGSSIAVSTFPSLGSGSGITSRIEHSDTLPLPQLGQLYVVSIWHDGLLGEIGLDTHATGFHGGGSFWEAFVGYRASDGTVEPLTVSWAPPAYRYWDPLAVAPEPEPESPLLGGYFLRGDPNLDGLGDGVEVNFN